MNTPSFIAAGAALAGFALGWALKPAGESAAPAETAGTPERARPGHAHLVAPGDQTAAKLAIRRAPAEGQVEGDSEKLALQLRMENTFHSLKNRRDRARLLRLSEALGLTEDQEKAIAALLSKRTDSLNPYDRDPSKPGDILSEAALAEGDFEQALIALLDDDQLARLESFKSRESDNRVEARAQQELAQIIGNVDLDAGQRDAVLEVFRDAQRARDAENPAGWTLLQDSVGLGAKNADMSKMRDLFSDPAVANDPRRLHQRMVEIQRQQNQEQLDLIENILTPAQLNELRATLDSSNLFIEHIMSNTDRDPRFR